EGQHFAHFLLAFSDQQSTNRAIFNGLVIEGAHIRVCKFIPEPIQCLHCQHFDHFACECKATAPTCACCAKPHTTVSCMAAKGIFSGHCCANCGLTGHGAVARACSIFAQ
ncbi:hypothetical protein BDQ17DRAFT_1255953, partial [Cyathus striatus]